MHYSKIHFKDYAADTAHLTLLEHGVYFQMMRLYYTNEKPLPPEPERVARFIGARTADEIEAVTNILQEFFTLETDGWHQKRIDSELASFHERCEINARAGKLGGRPSKANRNRNETETVTNRNRTITLPTTHNPLTNTKPKTTSATANAVALPDWVPKDAWDAFVETRGRIRAPLTERAKTLAVRELSKLRDQGHDCRAVLEQSVLNGWRGLFAPKAQPKSRDQFEGAL